MKEKCWHQCAPQTHIYIYISDSCVAEAVATWKSVKFSRGRRSGNNFSFAEIRELLEQVDVMPLFLLDNFCRYICDGRLEMRRERNEIVLNY
jgi:hypothetical protein